MRQLYLVLFLSLAAFGQTSYRNGGLTSEGPTNYCGSDTGSGNSYMCANPVGATVATLQVGNIYSFKATHANTGSATLAIDGLSALAITKQANAAALVSGDIAVGSLVTVQYDGTQFEMVSHVANAATGNQNAVTINGGTVPANAVLGTDGSNRPIDATAAVKVVNGKSVLRDFVTLKTYVDTDDPLYIPTFYSYAINSVVSHISTTAGSPIVTCPSICNFNSTATPGNSIHIFSFHTQSFIDSTILSVDSGTQITMTSNADITDTVRLGWWGTDSSAGFLAAWNAAKALNAALYIPRGSYGCYSGCNLSGWNQIQVYGDGMDNSLIAGGGTNYFIDGNEFWQSTRIHGLGFNGFAGAIRNRYVGNNVSKEHGIYDNAFQYFFAAAFSVNSSDMPYVFYIHNHCRAANTISTFCYANAGADKGIVASNSFVDYEYAVKFGQLYSAIRFFDNDFIEDSYPSPRSSYMRGALWAVTNTSNQAQGPVITHNKFGNENLDTQDVRMLISDSSAPSGGQYFGDTQPTYTASTNYFNNWVFDETNIITGGVSGGLGTGKNPIVYTYTANLIGFKIAASVSGSVPGYLLQHDPSITPANNYTLSGMNKCGPVIGAGITTIVSDWFGSCEVDDPTGVLSWSSPEVASAWQSGNDAAGFLQLDTASLTTYTASAGTKATITDPEGGQNGITLTSASDGTVFLIAHPTLNPVINGVPVWISFKIRTNTSDNITLRVNNHTSTATFFQSQPIHAVSSTVWKTHYIKWVPSAAISDGSITIAFVNSAVQTSTFAIDLANIRIYQALKPLVGNQQIGWVNTLQGGYCMDGAPALTGHCIYHGTGAPTNSTMADGSWYFRDDTPWGLYNRQSGAWVYVLDCPAGVCSMSALLVNRTGGGDPGIQEQVSGTTVTILHGKSGGGFYVTNGAGSTTWANFGTSGVEGLTAATVAITAAATIAPTAQTFHVTGATGITTITPPNGCTTAALACTLVIIPDSAVTFSTGGNIAAALVATINVPVVATYDPGASLFYLK